MDRRDDTMNLDALRDMLSDVNDTDDFDLDSIMAEFNVNAPAARPRPTGSISQSQAIPSDRRAAVPSEPSPLRAAPKTRAARRQAEPPPVNTQPPRRAQQTRTVPQPEEEEEYEPPVSEQHGKKGKKKGKVSRKEARAARRMAEQAEEESEIEVRDPTQAARVCKRHARFLSFRAVLVLLLAGAAVYLSLAPSFDNLPVPLLLDAEHNPTVVIGVLILLQFLAIFIGIDIFGMGFSSLFHGMPERSTLVSFAILASLLHAASIIVFDNDTGVEIPYLAISILLLYAAMREERGRYAAQARAYLAVSSAKSPLAIYSHYDSEDDVCRAVKGPLPDVRAFLVEIERSDTVDRFSLFYVPLALAASVICSLIASVGRGEPMRFFWAFSAILSVAAPISLLCSFGASYKNVSRKLLSQGAAIAGARQAHLLRGTEEVVLNETDIFPSGSISLESLQNLSTLSDDEILACAAALTDTAGLELGRVLSDATRERYGGVTLSARNVRLVEGGVTGEIGSSHVIVGTAALMVKMGIPIHPVEEDTVGLYLLIDNTLAGILSLYYQPTKGTYQAMRLMRRMHMNAMLAAWDFNVSPAMIEEQFDLHRGFVDQLEPSAYTRLNNPNYTRGDAPAAMLTREGAGPFMQALRCADKLAGAVRSALILGTFAGICGMAIVFYLVYQNAVSALPVVHLLLYQVVWYIPVFLIVTQTNS